MFGRRGSKHSRLGPRRLTLAAEQQTDRDLALRAQGRRDELTTPLAREPCEKPEPTDVHGKKTDGACSGGDRSERLTPVSREALTVAMSSIQPQKGAPASWPVVVSVPVIGSPGAILEADQEPAGPS